MIYEILYIIFHLSLQNVIFIFHNHFPALFTHSLFFPTALHCSQPCVSSFLQSLFDEKTKHKTFGSCLSKLITAHDTGVGGGEDVYTTRRVII